MCFNLKSPQNYNKEPIQHHILVLNRLKSQIILCLLYFSFTISYARFTSE